MSNDLSPLWIKEALKQERSKRNECLRAYESLVNKEYSYARGIKRVLDIREKVVAIWEDAANAVAVAEQQPTAASQNLQS